MATSLPQTLEEAQEKIIMNAAVIQSLESTMQAKDIEIQRLEQELAMARASQPQQQSHFSPPNPEEKTAEESGTRWEALRRSPFYSWYERLKSRVEYYTAKEEQVNHVISSFGLTNEKKILRQWHENCMKMEQKHFEETLKSFRNIDHLIRKYARVTTELEEVWEQLKDEHDQTYQSMFQYAIDNPGNPNSIAKRTSWVFNTEDLDVQAIIELKDFDVGVSTKNFPFNKWLTELAKDFQREFGKGLVSVQPPMKVLDDGEEVMLCHVKGLERLFFKTFYNLPKDVNVEKFVKAPFLELTDFLRAKFVFFDWKSLYRALLMIDEKPIVDENVDPPTHPDPTIAYYRNDFARMTDRVGGFKSILLLVKIPIPDDPDNYILGEVQLTHHIFASYVEKTHETYEFIRYFRQDNGRNFVQDVLDAEQKKFGETVVGEHQYFPRRLTSVEST